jgi:crotonobetainyl-CoA:carnitine CoA-transferase CaiB-like acyl-CoA transferase
VNFRVPPLQGISAVSIAVNLPGPLSAARLRDLGAAVTKVEPPDGDPLETFAPAWYAELSDGQQIVRLDLKRKAGRAELDRLFDGADVFLTAQRPDALERLGLGWARLHAHFPRLSHIAIVGHRSPDAHRPGHDLNYVASRGLAIPPDLPRTLVADIGGAEAAVSATLAALVNRERTGEGSHVEVALTEAADRFAAPFRHGLTRPGGLLAGGYAGYGLYEARDGWVSVAALEPHFRRRLCDELGLPELSHESLAGCFRTRSADAWEQWAAERDLPIEKVVGMQEGITSVEETV